MNWSTEQEDVINTILRLVAGECVYIDGEAGTGKTTCIQEACDRLGNVLRCAPSAIASTNIKGRTLHKTVQLNGKFYFDRRPIESRRKERYAEFGKSAGKQNAQELCKSREEILRFCNAIWIDESPMARCDLPDELDIRLRHIMKKPHTPFGGKRIIFSGDLGQLQAVVGTELRDGQDPEVDKTDEELLLENGYEAPFGFQQSRIYKEAKVKTIHLTKLFRQTDPIEGAILSRLRTASQTLKDLEHINRNVVVNPPAGATVLSYHRNTAKAMNDKALNELTPQKLTFVAKRTGTYAQKWPQGGKWKIQGPFLENLRLKIGCRVIIKTNGICNIDGCKIPYGNGDAGTLFAVDKQQRLLIERTDGQVIRLAPKKTGDVTDKKVMEPFEEEDEEGNMVTGERPVLKQITKGQFIQYPITLGYAQTGHSSQGLTLNRVHVALPPRKPRSPNWIYVVFSRVKSLKNLTLNRPLTMEDVWVIPGLKKSVIQQHELL